MKDKFEIAIFKGDLDKIKECLNQGDNPTIWDNWAIIRASENGHIEVLKLLFKDSRVRKSLRKEDIKGLIEREYKLFKLRQFK